MAVHPFVKLDVFEMRSALSEISGGELKVWLAYRLRANRQGEAWPGLETLAKDTGLSASRASKLRANLVKKAWLIAAGKGRSSGGTFASPRFRTAIPNHRTAKTAHGENAVPRESLSPHAENNSHRTAKTAHEVFPIKKNPPNQAVPPTNLACSVRCADGWEFIGRERIGSESFEKLFAERFKVYQEESEVCLEQSKCSCLGSAFLDDVIDQCKGRNVTYPAVILRLKKEFVAKESE